MRNIIILLGPPGAGKGTVGSELSDILNIPLISSGDLLRENVKKCTVSGEKAQKYMDAGELVPDDIVIEMIEGRVSGEKCKEGFILDGFPRTLVQAEMLDKIISDKDALNVFYLKAGDDFLVNRLSNRRVCGNCGKIYHLVNIPPKKPGVCDVCGGHLVQRQDDNEEIIRKRLSVYRDLTAPLLDYYKKKGVFYPIPGDTDIKRMLGEIKKTVQW